MGHQGEQEDPWTWLADVTCTSHRHTLMERLWERNKKKLHSLIQHLKKLLHQEKETETAGRAATNMSSNLKWFEPRNNFDSISYQACVAILMRIIKRTLSLLTEYFDSLTKSYQNTNHWQMSFFSTNLDNNNNNNIQDDHLTNYRAISKLNATQMFYTEWHTLEDMKIISTHNVIHLYITCLWKFKDSL